MHNKKMHIFNRYIKIIGIYEAYKINESYK